MTFMEGIVISTKTKKKWIPRFSDFSSPFIKDGRTSTHYQLHDDFSLNMNHVCSSSLYVIINNESDYQMGLERLLKRKLKNKGFSIVKNPNRAQYILGLKKIGIMSYDELQKILANSYGSQFDISNYKLLDDLPKRNLLYFLILDVQINEWIGLLHGKNNKSISQISNFKTFKTRLIISINKIDLNVGKISSYTTLSALDHGLIRVISGIF